MKKNGIHTLKLIALAMALPFVYGCGAGAGTGALLGFLFGGGGIGNLALLNSGDGIISGGASLAAIHNPEPASMLLVGSGIVAMSYLKSKSKNRNK